MSEEISENPISTGVSVIKSHVKKLPSTPGVYRMLGEKGDVLYVGKAKSLKNRVMSYAHFDRLPIRIQRMVALTRSMEFVYTKTEVEALLLESNLIKKLKPRYNILLRDDKSFPYILITGDHPFPTVTKHRGAKKRKGEYFGPFAGAGDVNRTIAILQRVFMLRNCTDNYFAARKRPCLQYHIKRCTAPCVGKVSQGEYADQVGQAEAFLQGRSDEIQKRFAKEMQDASKAQNYEAAAEYRDKIKALAAVQARQDINVAGLKNADVVAMVREGDTTCIQVFFFRSGQNYGNRSYYPRHASGDEPEAIMAAFLAQFYESKPIPQEIIVSHEVEDQELLEAAFAIRLENNNVRYRVKITIPQRGQRKRLVDFVARNATLSLKQHISAKAGQAKLLEGVAELFGMEEPPQRIEVYDNSHISGTHMVGAMIVAGLEGFRKNAYRKFNIKEAGASDDYAMMREVLTRRFKRALKEDVDKSGEDWPNLLLIDGGKGQYSAAHDVLEECGILDDVTLVAIAKGEDRDAGREWFFIKDTETGKLKELQLPVNNAVLHYLQRLRDEAHRFAIGAHRTRREKAISSSPLDNIEGIGAKRKKALLAYFGSAKAVAEASADDLVRIEGVSKALAQKIYDHFH